MHAIVANQNKLIDSSHADAGRPMRPTNRPMPRNQPIPTARMRRHLFPIPGRTP
jgi:hypothetical protein